MNLTLRPASRITFAALALAAISVAAFAQPTPTPAPAGPVPTPATGPGAGPSVGSAPPLPGPAPFGPSASMFEGVISGEEYKQYTEFQQRMNDDPAIKVLNAKIMEQTRELQRLRGEANAVREKLIAANPEIKAIQDKIMNMMRSRASSGPAFLPGPAVPPKHN